MGAPCTFAWNSDDEDGKVEEVVIVKTDIDSAKGDGVREGDGTDAERP